VETPEVVEAAVVPTQPIQFAQPAKPFTLPSASDYIAKFMVGGAEFAEFNARIKAAAPDVVTTDTPGILPEPIVGSVYDSFQASRKTVAACGVKAMPSGGKIFRRPKVTTHTTIGASNGENVALDAGTFVVSDNQVTKAVYGGYVQLSEEDMEWTEPAVLSLIIGDMAKIYANQTDTVACTNLKAGATTTGNFTSANLGDPTEWLSWIYSNAAFILNASDGNMADTLFLDPGKWEYLGRLEDGSGRPLFPTVGPYNAPGTASAASTAVNAFGLNVVVDRNFAADTMILGDPSGFEIYEQQKGAISVEAADGSLSRFIKFRGYFATLMIDADKFVKANFV
jgi:hypothetical protein